MRDEDFKDWLRKEMEKQGLNQRDLASLSDIDHSSISRIIHSERAPSLYTATQLIEALGYNLIIQRQGE